MKNIKIIFQNQEYECKPPITPQDFIKQNNIPIENPIAVVINGHLTRIDSTIQVNSALDIIELNSYQGQRIFESNILFLFVVAFTKKFPDLNVFIQHSVPQGIFAEIKERSLSSEEIDSISDYMKELVQKNLPIKKISCDWDISLNKMKEKDRNDLINLFKYYSPSRLVLYQLDDIEESVYLPLLPNTGLIKDFKLIPYQNGLVILFADFEKGTKISEFKHRTKLFNTYKEYHNWCKILKIRTVGHLNKYIIDDKIGSLIKISEALHEKKVASIADIIIKKDFIPKIVFISGPSSSGKTTFSKRLNIQLQVNGLKPIEISLDNYFFERKNTPKNKNGKYDFESIRAIDIQLFINQLNSLLKGEEVTIPKFDFKTGSRKEGAKLKLEKNHIIIVEGIHGINPQLTSPIDQKLIFKIFVSALTQLNLHRHDRVPTSDTRLIRRIVRDSNFRGYSAGQTLLQWKEVRVGESENIYPFQEEADVIFNSALFYELSVLKTRAERELLTVNRNHPMYAETQRLLTFLSFFLPLESTDVPKTSILREFIGGSSFHY